MRKLFALLVTLSLTLSGYSQAPDQFKYQAIARDVSGGPLTNQSIGFEISIHQNSSGGTVVYSETHTVTSNSQGVVNLNIGGGTVTSGDFSLIDWGGAIYFLSVGMDETGGSSYTLMGSTQLLSVPYALNAKTVSAIDWTDVQNVPPDIADGDDDSDILAGLPCSANEIAFYNGSSWACMAIPNSTAGQDASDAYGTGQMTLTISSTTYTTIPGLTQTINVPANAKVFVSTYGGVQTVGTGTAYGIADIAIFVDGALMGAGGQQRVVAANTQGLGNMIDAWSLNKSYALSAGSHTISVVARDGGGSADINVSSGSAPLIQGVLSVLIINQ
ncbi:MAG: hypothetical protein HUJ25_15445 [Crocinitomicaceae bacterium]|nr:hypothetical protein [Crocinitomicaceae bacterium]